MWCMMPPVSPDLGKFSPAHSHAWTHTYHDLGQAFFMIEYNDPEPCSSYKNKFQKSRMIRVNATFYCHECLEAKGLLKSIFDHKL